MGTAVAPVTVPPVQVAVASAKNSPGVTTLCWGMALLWPGPVVVGELDPAGGDLAARLPLEPAGGVAAVAAAARHTLSWEQVVGQLQPVTGNCAALLGSPDPVLSRGSVAVLAEGLPAVARSAGVAGVWDLGRLDSTSPAWAAVGGCDLVAVMVRPTAGDVAHAVVLLDQLAARGCRSTAVVVAGPRRRRGAYRDEVVVDAIAERVSGPVVMLGRVAFDPLGVSMVERIMTRWAGKCEFGASVREVIGMVAVRLSGGDGEAGPVCLEEPAMPAGRVGVEGVGAAPSSENGGRR